MAGQLPAVQPAVQLAAPVPDLAGDNSRGGMACACLLSTPQPLLAIPRLAAPSAGRLHALRAAYTVLGGALAGHYRGIFGFPNASVAAFTAFWSTAGAVAVAIAAAGGVGLGGAIEKRGALAQRRQLEA